MHDNDEGIGHICRAIRRETHSKCIDPERIHKLADRISDLADEYEEEEPEEEEEEIEDEDEEEYDEDHYDDDEDDDDPDDPDYQ